MNKLQLLPLMLLMGACGGNGENDNKNDEGQDAAETTSSAPVEMVPSDQWQLVKFTDGEVGFQTPDSTIQVKGNFRSLRPFRNGFSVAEFPGSKGGGMALIDETGSDALPKHYNYVSDYASGLIAARESKDSKVGYVNLKGEQVIEPKYEMGFAFHNGLARVATGDYKSLLSLKGYEDAQYGFVNNAGEEVVPVKYTWAGDFVDGKAPVCEGNKCYFIDTTGARVDENTYDDISGYFGELCAVAKKGKYGIINKQGEEVLPFEFDNYMYFFTLNSSWGFSVNHEYELFGRTFQDAHGNFVMLKSTGWGILDAKGQEVTPFEYDEMGVETESGYVQYRKNGGKYGYAKYNKGKLQEIIPAEFDYIFHYMDQDLVVVAQGDYSDRKYGAYDLKGNPVVALEWDDVKDIGHGFASVKKGDLYGITNPKGELVSKVEFDYVGSADLDDKKIYVSKGDDSFYVDFQGKKLN